MKKYSGIKGKLDTLVGNFYRSRPCQRCGKLPPSQWVHTRSRRYLTTRWSSNNCLSFCAGCHKFAHDQPDAFTKWIEINLPGRIDALNEEFRNTCSWKEWKFKELYETLEMELK